MRRLIPLILIAMVATVSAAPPPKAQPSAPLTITADEKEMLLGFAGRAEAIQLRAERDLAKVSDAQREYLGRIATRLGIDPAKLATDYTVNVETLEVTPRAKGK